ncbi:uncharacterized protein LOC108109698 [Drosophila eugracilis]|uniref:uncharacterized protein LOC108109698 n=1 Tax=Drosophila eugracilis TaxID=29029 RepID=UPI0007E71D71|nr:uncharacterized protein LOC108109698 [Drosophila eugracilis]
MESQGVRFSNDVPETSVDDSSDTYLTLHFPVADVCKVMSEIGGPVLLSKLVAHFEGKMAVGVRHKASKFVCQSLVEGLNQKKIGKRNGKFVLPELFKEEESAEDILYIAEEQPAPTSGQGKSELSKMFSKMYEVDRTYKKGQERIRMYEFLKKEIKFVEELMAASPEDHRKFSMALDWMIRMKASEKEEVLDLARKFMTLMED